MSAKGGPVFTFNYQGEAHPPAPRQLCHWTKPLTQLKSTAKLISVCVWCSVIFLLTSHILLLYSCLSLRLVPVCCLSEWKFVIAKRKYLFFRCDTCRPLLSIIRGFPAQRSELFAAAQRKIFHGFIEETSVYFECAVMGILFCVALSFEKNSNNQNI